MASTTANAYLKEDGDALVLSSGAELSIQSSFTKSQPTFVALELDAIASPGDANKPQLFGIDDSSGDYGPGGSEGDAMWMENITIRMSETDGSDFKNQATLPRFSRGLSGGPSFRTVVQETADGGEVRISKWQRPKRSFDIANAIDTPEDFRNLLDHYKHVRGSLHGFRLRDPFDWSTHPNHVGKPDHANHLHRQMIGAGDGATKNFQIIKRYAVGNAVERVRPITHPTYYYDSDRALDDDYVFEVYVDGSKQALGTHYGFINNGGVINFNSAPAAGTHIEWCGTFDVPVRFDQDIDQGMLARMDTTSSYSLRLSATELSISEPFSDHRWMGGGFKSVSIGSGGSKYAAVCINQARVWKVDAAGAGCRVYLPSTRDLKDGGTVVTVIAAAGSTAFDVYKETPPAFTATEKLTTLSSGEHVHCVLKSNGEFEGIE